MFHAKNSITMPIDPNYGPLASSSPSPPEVLAASLDAPLSGKFSDCIVAVMMNQDALLKRCAAGTVARSAAAAGAGNRPANLRHSLIRAASVLLRQVSKSAGAGDESADFRAPEASIDNAGEVVMLSADTISADHWKALHCTSEAVEEKNCVTA